MSTAHLCIALGPLTVYIADGAITSCQPFVTSGAEIPFHWRWEAALVMIGPLRLLSQNRLFLCGPLDLALLGAFYILRALDWYDK